MCKWYRLLFGLLPFLRPWIIKQHMDACPQCLDQSSWNNLRDTLRKDQESWTLNLWPGVLLKIREEKIQMPTKTSPVFSSSPSWRWLYGVGLSFILVAGFMFLRFQTLRPVVNISSSGTKKSSAFMLVSAKIEGEKAKAYVFHPNDSQVVIVWFQKT